METLLFMTILTMLVIAIISFIVLRKKMEVFAQALFSGTDWLCLTSHDD